MKKIMVAGFIFSLFMVSALCSASRFEYKIVKEDVFLVTQNSIFLVQPVSIVSGGSMMYLAAQDFTAKREMLLVNKTKDIKVIVDEKDRKVIKVSFLMADEKNNVYNDYELVLFLEIREGFPFLAVYSKFFYRGEGRRECAINWALDSSHEPFKYYTIPHKGEIKTFPLVKTRRTKIGHANWLFANRGDGVGAGLIAPGAILGRGEDFIFLNSVPTKKKLAKGESIDLFMIFVPINKNYKILPEIFEEVKNIKWQY